MKDHIFEYWKVKRK